MESFWTNCDSAMNLNVKENSQHDLVDTEKQLISNYESCSYKSKETLEETDFKGNSNLTNSVKTEPNVNHSQSPSSLFQGNF